MKDVVIKMKTSASFLEHGILTIEEAENLMNDDIHAWEDQHIDDDFDTYYTQKVKLNIKKWKLLIEATRKLLKN